MKETVVSVTEAANDFERLLETVERTREPAIVMREGAPVAKIVPMPAGAAAEFQDAIRRWKAIDRLPQDEAEAFANDLEEIHSRQPPLARAWD